MKKTFLPLIFIMLFCTQSYAIETIAFKDSVVAMTATTSPAATDIIPIVVNPATTPLMRKVTVANLRGTYSTIVALWTTCTGYLKSDGTCDTPGGTLTGTGTNHYWPYWTGTSTLGAKSITASKPVCSDSSGDPGVCAGTEGVWQVAGTYLTSSSISNTAYDATSWDNVTDVAPSKNAVRDKFESQPLYTEPGGLQLLKRTSASNVGASGITDDGTTVDAGALHFATTGIISGKVGVITKSSAYTLGTDAAKESYGYMMLATGAMVLTLPAGVVGMSGCALERDVSEALSVKPASGEQMVLNGTKLDANHKVTSASGAGDFVCYAVLETGVWYVLGKSGTWTDGAE